MIRGDTSVQSIWLNWARELQAIAQTGLAFSKNAYDLDRYRAIRSLAARIAAEHSEVEFGRIEALSTQQAGYATPKVDVRGAVFDSDGGIQMVREIEDAGRWTLPGGWADVNRSPAECVTREVREESGFEVLTVKGLGIERFEDSPPVTQDGLMKFSAAVRASVPRADSMLISCGALKTLEIVAPLEKQCKVPVVSSLPHALRAGVRLLGLSGRSPGYGKLLAKS